ncbi:hypothetical protein GSB9_00042 [Flavobacteriaceae bacterium GSB9]|nr:hypothetical protein GSB9_00042 [Flavobacteriaceae bacterium GSB9]
MKSIRSHLKIITCFFTLLVFLQGCVVYKSEPATIEAASEPNVKVRIKMIDGEFIKFSSLEVVDNKIFGVKKKRGEAFRTLIGRDSIKRIQIKDKKMSTIGNVLLPVSVIGSIVLLTISRIENSIL